MLRQEVQGITAPGLTLAVVHVRLFAFTSASARPIAAAGAFRGRACSFVS